MDFRAALITGVVILVSVVITIYFWYKRYERKRKKENKYMSQPKYTAPDVQCVQSVYKPDNIGRSHLRMTESCKDVVQSEDEAGNMDNSQLRTTESRKDAAQLVHEADNIDMSLLKMTESRKNEAKSVDEADTIDSSQMGMTESCKDVVQSLDEAETIARSQLRITESRKDVVQSVDETDTIDNSQLIMTESGKDVVQSVDETDTVDNSLLRMTESRKDVVQSVDETDTVDNSQLRMTETCKDVVQSVDETDTVDSSLLRMTESRKDVVQSVDKTETIARSQLRMTECQKDVVQSVDETDTIKSSQLRMTESYKDVVQSVDEADTIYRSLLRLTESGDDVVQSVDEADKDPSQNSPTDLQSMCSSQTELEQRSTHIPSIEVQQIQGEEENLLQAAFTVLYTVPRAIEDFINREYKGGLVQAIYDNKDKLKTKLSSEEWELLSKFRVHHRIYHFYDQIIQDTILDNEVLDLLISKCILRKEDREEIGHYPRQSDRSKCILDLLIQRQEDSYSVHVLLEVLKESPTCSTDLIKCMESQQFSHLKVVPQSRVKPCITGLHSVRLQKNYHNLIQNVSNTESIIDSLITKGVLVPDDRAEINISGVQAKINRKLIDKIRSKQDYQFFVEALNEESTNAKLASDLESIDVTKDELKLLETETTVSKLTNRPGFQTMVTLISMVKAVEISDTEPESHDSRLAADLYRLQFWYKKIIKATNMDSHQYQQFVQTVKEIVVRFDGNNGPGVEETSLNTGTKTHVQKILNGLKEKWERNICSTNNSIDVYIYSPGGRVV